jgi:tetratricopeptide (TPR) repeat protein
MNHSNKLFGNTGNSVYITCICLVLVAIVLAVYTQVVNHQFLNIDDDVYVTLNPHVINGITGKNIIWAFTSFDAGNWHPITWLSHMADVQLYGLNPSGHHLTNVVIHTASSLLLLLLLFRLTDSLWQSSFVAALFALHPLHVESVAWIAERKDVLSALFWFLTLLIYSEYVAKRKPVLFMLTLFSFTLGLMAKPMLVTLPIIMLLMDFWPLDRYRSDENKQCGQQLFGNIIILVKEKIPFFVCSLFSCVMTIYSQQQAGAVSFFSEIPFWIRFENALTAYVKYIVKTFWPVGLGVYYPFHLYIPLWQAISSFLVLLIFSVVVILARRRYPFFLVGWFWFLVSLLPVIGLIQVGGQSMADRYSYIPLIGLFIMLAWGVPEISKGIKYREFILALPACLVIFAITVLTWQQIGYWRDSISLYKHTLQFTDNSYLVNNNLGRALAEKGDIDAAILEYQKVLRIFPNDPVTLINLGDAYAKQGNLEAAIQAYQDALRKRPDNTDALNGLGIIFSRIKDHDASIEEFRKALRIKPNDSIIHYNLGIAFAAKGNTNAAIQEYQEALRINPVYSDAHYNLGRALSNKGDLDIAIHEFQETLRINPNNAEAHNHLGISFASKGKLDIAIQEFQKALQLNPNNSDMHNNLGFTFALKGDLDAAIQEYQVALRISPNEKKVQNNINDAFAQKRKQDETRKSNLKNQ